MTHLDAVDRFVAEMRGRGVDRWTCAPPFFRLLWWLGAEVPPPFFLSFRSAALLAGSVYGIGMGLVWYGVLWCVAMFLPEARKVMVGTDVLFAIGLAVLLAGTLFGLSMAWYFTWKRRSLKLPSWGTYLADGAALSDGSGAPETIGQR